MYSRSNILKNDEPYKIGSTFKYSQTSILVCIIQVWNCTTEQLTEEAFENLLENISEIKFFIPTQQKPL